MTNYSINTDIRVRISFIIAALSIFLILLLQRPLGGLGVEVSVFSSFSLYLALHWMFDHYIWKWPGVCKIHGVPDLNGDYDCIVERPKSERNFRGENDYEEFQLSAQIDQTFSKISVEVASKNRLSIVTSAAFEVTGSSRSCFRYSYAIKPIRDALDNNMRGEGLQELYVKDDSTIEGLYFSTKPRRGTMRLTRV